MLVFGSGESNQAHILIELLSPAMLRWPAFKISQAEHYLIFPFFLFNLIECKNLYNEKEWNLKTAYFWLDL